MKRLLMLDYFRGPDSTGFAGIKGNGDHKIVKVSSHPLDLFEMTGFKSALNGNSSTVFLGHNRAATKGKVISTNAHPFQFGHIIGAHNGTLSVMTHRALEDKLDEKFEVDSMAIFACIEKFGVEETVALFKASVSGVSCLDAWALVWYDLNQKTLNFLRNKERPMWYSYSKGFDRILWASEWPMIQAAVELSQPGYELFASEPDSKGNTYNFFSMDEDVLYSYDIDELKKGSTVRPKPLAKKISGKGAETASVKSTYDPFQRTNGPSSIVTYPEKKSGKTTGYLTTLVEDKEEKLLHLVADRADPYGGVITETRFADLARYGCSWCQQDVFYNDVGCTIFDRDDILLCPDCSAASVGSNRIFMKHVSAG